MNGSRRALLGASAATVLCRGALAAEPLRVAFVYISPISDNGWSFQHDLGRRGLEAVEDAPVQTSYAENIDEGPDAERVIRRFATEGSDLIFATSLGYLVPVLKIAQQFPKVRFEYSTGARRTANVATYSARFYEGRYIAGLVAGRMTTSAVIGYIAPFPIMEVLQGINAFTLGARSVNPKVQVRVVWTMSWYDPDKERAMATALIAQKADVLTHHTDSPAVVQTGQARGVFTIGYNSDMSKFGPTTCLTSVMPIWGDYYVSRVKSVVAGTWASGDTWGGFRDGMMTLAPFSDVVPEAVQNEAEARIAQIAGGTFKPFQGPIMDQAGKAKVAANATLGDADIMAMQWFVQGVQAKI